MNEEELIDYMNALDLDKPLRNHLYFFFRRGLFRQIELIINAFSEVGGRTVSYPCRGVAPKSWADAAAVRIMAQMDMPTFGNVRRYLARCIEVEVERRVKQDRPPIE